MSDLSWWKEEDTASVYAYLAAQLDAINSLPAAKRKPYIAHEIRCNACRSVVVQVVTLKYPDPDGTDCRVIWWRDHETLPLNLPDPDEVSPREHGRLAAEAVARRPESYRRGAWRWQIATGDDRGSVFPVCQCRSYTFTVAGILARHGPESTTGAR